ncbi:hypothetical protein [Microbacterium sp. 77mftsu3.1]|uniref:hypothetical protein n=1 Tax=Microbacterium sp. 77mftsu3.1 TaxID=1761802 RepID=UPI00036EF71B|nr:hypothetical protein [Microbacterium sp. 77mftsu3.1]SDH56245.1 hypothetical protein SAMN04488590_3585 [Microbacterium sp. 77mftsu3.1]
MSLRICEEANLHPSHRWEEGEYTPFCPGRYGADSGAWLADRSRKNRKLRGKVHFYLPDAEKSVCGYGWREAGMLPFDRETRETTEPDPRFGDVQFRTPCAYCSDATATFVVAAEVTV